MFALAAKARKHWAPIGFVGATAIAIAPFKGSFFDPGNVDAFFVAMAAIGATLTILLLLSVLLIPIERALAGADVSLCVRNARRPELEELLPFYQSVLGGPTPPLNEIKRIFSANKTIVRLLERVTRRKGDERKRVVGFCSVFPLKKEAVALVDREQLTGLQMSKRHICKPSELAAAIYIGSIGAKGAEAKASILGYVLGCIQEQQGRGVRVIYTRPTTKDGLRVAKQYGFEPVASDARPDELGRIYKLTGRTRRMRATQLPACEQSSASVARASEAHPGLETDTR